ncbi:hypothetical protein ACMVYQ_10385 [Staphylococcus capitis]|uniref:hypothetical protein n=1 Tax=Staphylococcus TaxID=1279 RepID=UPI0020166A9D|nr:hypothetical protein [Staphylococcus sp. U]
MENSIFWKRSFIPVYFVVAFLIFLLFKFYIKTDVYAVYIFPMLLVAFSIASLISNSRR